MRLTPFVAAASAAGLALMPSLAAAHPGPGHAAGFAHGLAHPLGGADHVLAMVLVGVLAHQLGGRARWLAPLTFLAVMALGGLVGAAGLALPHVETAIAVSVIVLGAVVALRLTTRPAVGAALVGVFALAHGIAHGAEMPADTTGLAYGLGFLAATALLHGAGFAAAALAGRAATRPAAVAIRAGGALAAVAGFAILAG